jgi:hypothetical protein
VRTRHRHGTLHVSAYTDCSPNHMLLSRDTALVERGQGVVESHMSVPDARIEATWYCDQTSQASQRKLPRGLRSKAEVAAVSPHHTFSLPVSGCFSARASCLCLALVADRGSVGWHRDDAVEVRWMAVLLSDAGSGLVMGLGLGLGLGLRGERSADKDTVQDGYNTGTGARRPWT